MQNINIRIPADYFRNVPRKEYQNYRMALAREFIQNSDDAGATETHFWLDRDARTLRVRDNGCGMTEDILVNKLLVLGGSHKPEGAVGGFGKAKELLFLAHRSFEIRTQDLIYRGSGMEGTLERVETSITGTDILVNLYEDEDLSNLSYFMHSQLQNSNPRSSVYFNGELVTPTHSLGQLKPLRVIADEEGNIFGQLYFDPNTPSNYIKVRVRGIWMFSLYLNDEMTGTPIIELSGSSVDKLTANRDGIAYQYSRLFQEQVNEILIDKVSALRSKPAEFEYLRGPDGPIYVTSGKLQRQVSAAISSGALEDGTFLKAFTQALGELHERKALSDLLSQFAYRSDFVLYYNMHVPKALHPHTWSKSYRKLALLWETTLKTILSALEEEQVFAIGWHLEKGDAFSEVNASTMVDGSTGRRCFFLNPLSTAYTKTKFRDLVWEIVEAASHEITHLYKDYHDESFSAKNADIRRRIRSIDFYKLLKAMLRDEMGDSGAEL